MFKKKRDGVCKIIYISNKCVIEYGLCILILKKCIYKRFYAGRGYRLI